MQHLLSAFAGCSLLLLRERIMLATLVIHMSLG